MAVEFQIYLHDCLIQTNSNVRRPIQEIKDTLIEIDPDSNEPQRIITTNKGYIASYSNEEHINFIFIPDNIEKLNGKHLKAELTSETQLHRQVVITGVTQEICSKQHSDIIQEIRRTIPVNILQLSVYESLHNNNRYIFVTVDTKETKDQLLTNGTVVLYDTNYSVLPTRSKQRTTNSGSHNPARNVINHSAQRAGQAPPQLNNWRTQRQNYYSGTTNTAYPPPNSSSPRNIPPQGPQLNLPTRVNQNHYNSSFGLSHIDIKFISETYSRVCETLSYGLENPKAYVSLINQSLAHKGLPEIYVADSALNDCRELFLRKLSGKYSAPLSQTLPYQQNNTNAIPSSTSSYSTIPSTDPTNSSSTSVPSVNPPIQPTLPNSHPATTTIPTPALPNPSSYSDPTLTPVNIHSASVPDPTTTHSASASTLTSTPVPTSLPTQGQHNLTHCPRVNRVLLFNIAKYISVVAIVLFAFWLKY